MEALEASMVTKKMCKQLFKYAILLPSTTTNKTVGLQGIGGLPPMPAL